MDLIPVKPAPAGTYLHYNMHGWGSLLTYLEKWDVNIDEFAGANESKRISAKTCIVVANTIEMHLEQLPQDDQEWLRPQVEKWRAIAKAGGCEQW